MALKASKKWALCLKTILCEAAFNLCILRREPVGQKCKDSRYGQVVPKCLPQHPLGLLPKAEHQREQRMPEEGGDEQKLKEFG